MNSLSINELIPLEMDKHGVIRVGKTRVTLDTLIGAFCDGATAEEIVQQYPSLQLSDVYYVIGFYLKRTSEIEEYLEKRKGQAEIKRDENEIRFQSQGIRERLKARYVNKARSTFYHS